MHPLISVSDLNHLMNQSSPFFLFDCSFDLVDPKAGYQSYLGEHIIGACYADSETDLSGPKDGKNGRHPLPTLEQWQATLQAWGVSKESHIIAYDRQGNMFAARLWWMLRSSGFQSVQVLDGGLNAWKAQGFKTSSGPVLPNSPNTQLKLSQVFQNRVLMKDVQNNLSTSKDLIIDARPNDRFHGKNEILDPVAGHIPGAKNRCFKDNLNADGFFKPANILKEEFLKILDRSPEEIIHQCGSGATACHNFLAMELAGLPGSKIYAGSWSEWCAYPENPVSTV